MVLKKLTSEIVNSILLELQKEKNKYVFQTKIIDPIINYIIYRLEPYIIGSFVVFGLLLLLIVLIIVSIIIKVKY